jgi:hypothetical protein
LSIKWMHNEGLVSLTESSKSENIEQIWVTFDVSDINLLGIIYLFIWPLLRSGVVA